MDPRFNDALDAAASVLLDYEPFLDLLGMAKARALDMVWEISPDHHNEADELMIMQFTWSDFVRAEWFESLTKEQRNGLLRHKYYDVRTAARAAMVGIKRPSR